MMPGDKMIHGQTLRKYIAELLDNKRFGVLANVLEESLAARNKGDLIDDDFTVVSSILMMVIHHLRFLDDFGDAGVPHMDTQGTFHNRHDEFFAVWIGLGAFSVDADSITRAVK